MVDTSVVDTGTVSKHPDLEAIVIDLKKEAVEIEKKSSDLRQTRDNLLKQIQPLEAKLREVDKQIIAIERPRLPQIKQQLGALAKTMGGKSMGISSPKQ